MLLFMFSLLLCKLTTLIDSFVLSQYFKHDKCIFMHNRVCQNCMHNRCQIKLEWTAIWMLAGKWEVLENHLSKQVLQRGHLQQRRCYLFRSISSPRGMTRHSWLLFSQAVPVTEVKSTQHKIHKHMLFLQVNVSLHKHTLTSYENAATGSTGFLC